MQFTHTTFVPNYLFDSLLPKLTFAEVKVILIIIRQTNGWVCKKTGGRKRYDRISHGQFIKKSNLSRRTISATISSLVEKGLIEVRDTRGTLLSKAEDRQGRMLLYSVVSHLPHMATYAQKRKDLCNRLHITKETRTKERKYCP